MNGHAAAPGLGRGGGERALQATTFKAVPERRSFNSGTCPARRSTVQPLQDGPSAEDTLHNVHSLEYLAPVIRLEASIDARIDRLLVRLVNINKINLLRPFQLWRAKTLIRKSRYCNLKMINILLFN
jgi:hypothetical protein